MSGNTAEVAFLSFLKIKSSQYCFIIIIADFIVTAGGIGTLTALSVLMVAVILALVAILTCSCRYVLQRRKKAKLSTRYIVIIYEFAGLARIYFVIVIPLKKLT